MKSNSFRIAYGAVVILLAALAAAAVAALVIRAVGASPMATFATILTGPFQDLFGVTEILVRVVPLTLVGLGIAIAFRSGIINIGAEGQMVMGILAATATALALPHWPKAALLPLVLLAGALGGGLWASVAGFLRARLGVNEILSTVMLNYIAAQFYTFLLRGPMIDPGELETGSGTPQSMRLPEAAFLNRLMPGTRLHAGLILALVLAAGVYVLLWHTTWGFRLRAAGAEAKAARYAGIRVEGSLMAAMVLSGAFAGLAGAVEVCGVHHRAIENISAGYGFSGIVVALFGALHPAGIVPAAAFFGLLLVGADMTQRSAGVPANMILVLEGVIILSIVSAKMYLNNAYAQERAKRWWDRVTGAAPANGAAAPGPAGPEPAAPEPAAPGPGATKPGVKP
jgi:simple sugar transport system permease protein